MYVYLSWNVGVLIYGGHRVQNNTTVTKRYVVPFALVVFVLFLVYPMLPVSLDCALWICPVVFSYGCFPIPFVFCIVLCFCLSSSWILYPRCCQCLSSIRSWLLLRFSLPFICSSLLFYINNTTVTKRYVVFFALLVFVLCLVQPMLPVLLNCPLWICPVVFSNVYLLISLVLVFFFLSSSWGLHVHCCLCLSIIHLWFIISIIAFFNISYYVDWYWKIKK